MKAKDLKVGDRIRIIGPSLCEYVHEETKEIFNILLNKEVTVSEIDETGIPWFEYQHEEEFHFIAVLDNDKNWILSE